MHSLREKAILASQHSHSPYSLAQVGSVVVCEDGTEYSGTNIENSSYGGTVCAERVAIWKAVSEGHKKITKVYVYTKAGWPPCGMCLQVMTEFADPQMEITIGNETGVETTKKLNEFLTQAFTPDHLKK